jgi:shikimate kinase
MTATFHTLPAGWTPNAGRPHIIFVGLPGAGKSTVGRAVAERLGRGFLDLDREIERREGRSISEIFAERGEHYFRGQERELTEALRSMGDLVIAPGGGWITNPEVVALLRPPGRIIYLKVRPASALARLGPERAQRPLLMRPDPLGELTRLLKEREPMYGLADHTVDTERLEPQQVIDKVAELASTFT